MRINKPRTSRLKACPFRFDLNEIREGSEDSVVRHGNLPNIQCGIYGSDPMTEGDVFSVRSSSMSMLYGRTLTFRWLPTNQSCTLILRLIKNRCYDGPPSASNVYRSKQFQDELFITRVESPACKRCVYVTMTYNDVDL